MLQAISLTPVELLRAKTERRWFNEYELSNVSPVGERLCSGK